MVNVSPDLEHHFKNKLFYIDGNDKCIVIPRNVKIAESPSFGQPIVNYATTSKGSIAYKSLANAILGV